MEYTYSHGNTRRLRETILESARSTKGKVEIGCDNIIYGRSGVNLNFRLPLNHHDISQQDHSIEKPEQDRVIDAQKFAHTTYIGSLATERKTLDFTRSFWSTFSELTKVCLIETIS